MTIHHRPARRVLALPIAVAVLTISACGSDEASTDTEATSSVSTASADPMSTTGPTSTPSSSAEPADAPGTTQAGPSATTAPESVPASSPSTSLESASATTVDADAAPDAGPAADACRLITVDEAAAALGKDVVETPETMEFDGGATGPGASCGYRAVNEDSGNSVIQVSVLGTGFPLAAWEQAQQAEGYQPVSGVGDAAFYDDDTTMEVLVGGTWLSMQMIGSERYDEVLAVLTEVAQTAVERL